VPLLPPYTEDLCSGEHSFAGTCVRAACGCVLLRPLLGTDEDACLHVGVQRFEEEESEWCFPPSPQGAIPGEEASGVAIDGLEDVGVGSLAARFRGFMRSPPEVPLVDPRARHRHRHPRRPGEAESQDEERNHQVAAHPVNRRSH
jgi:hypothetical protein